MDIHYQFFAKMVNIVTVFLHGDVEEEVHMKCPQVMSDIVKDDYIILNKCTYGLVQAGRQYYKTVVDILKKSGFLGGNVNPCSEL